MATPGFSASQEKLLRSLSTPARIQSFLDQRIRYDPGEHCRSPLRLMRDGSGHCMEGALFGAFALRRLGYPPLVVDLEAERDDDHVIAIYRQDRLWGSVAKSNYSGLRARQPVYRTIRELVMSYFEHYYNTRGARSLRAYSLPVNLSRFDKKDWMTSNDDPWFIAEHLCKVPHLAIGPVTLLRGLPKVDARSKGAGEYGLQK